MRRNLSHEKMFPTDMGIVRIKKHIVTSTPLKDKTTKNFDLEWVSPIKKISKEFQNPSHPTTKSNSQKSAELTLKQTEENKNSDKCSDAETESTVKIHIDIDSRGLNDGQKPSALNSISVEPESNKVKGFVIMDSDEEKEFWQSKQKSGKKRKNSIKKDESLTNEGKRSTRKKRKTQERVESVKPASDTEERIARDSMSQGIILPKIVVDSNEALTCVEKSQKSATPPKSSHTRKNMDSPPQKALKKSKKSSSDSLSNEAKDELKLIKWSRKPAKTIDKDNETAERRSTRKRCKPLEFWNGERMEIDRDFTVGIGEVLRDGKVVFEKRKLKKKAGEETKRKELEPRNKVSTSNPKPEPSLAEEKKNTKRKSVVKSKVNTLPEAKVRFSPTENGTTINGPTSKPKTEPDWRINFTKTQLAMERLPASENCVVLPGLNTEMGVVSSAVIWMRPKFVVKSQAPELQHMIFCLMTGTVSVTIDKISARLERNGHFAVPSGVSYIIENIGRQTAVLSSFKIACNCGTS